MTCLTTVCPMIANQSRRSAAPTRSIGYDRIQQGAELGAGQATSGGLTDERDREIVGSATQSPRVKEVQHGGHVPPLVSK
jgi:hypothetical protein